MSLSNDEVERLVLSYLNYDFYFLFIEWPDNPVPEYLWMDRNGDIKSMDSMGLDHLKASSRLVENSLQRISSPPTPPKEVVSILEPSAKAKLKELQETFREKVNS